MAPELRAIATIRHGTTHKRAKLIVKNGPSATWIEPNGFGAAETFSACLAGVPSCVGEPEEYAESKSRGFPDEGGPAVVEVDVPDYILKEVFDDKYYPRSQGLVQFSPGIGLETLLAAWSTLPKRVILLNQ